MRTSEPKGAPFTGHPTEPIDEWSREVFDALSSWAAVLEGQWTKWDDRYLLLKIDRLGDESIEPILLDTAEGELTVEFGYWETHLPEQAADAVATAHEAITLVSRWLSGDVRTAVFTNDAGGWCGTMLIERDDTVPPEPSAGMAYFKPTRVELRSPRKQDWISYSL